MAIDLSDNKLSYSSGLASDTSATDLFSGNIDSGVNTSPTDHAHGIAEKVAREGEEDKTYRLQQTNYDYAVVHNKASHYYGKKQQVVHGDYVLTADKIFLECNKMYSYLSGETINKAPSIKEVHAHWFNRSLEATAIKANYLFAGANVDISGVLAKTEISFNPFKLGIEYGGGMNFSLGGNVNIYYEPESFLWHFKDSFKTEGQPSIKELRKSIFGLARTDITLGERREMSMERQESYAKELDQIAESYQLTTKTNEQISEENSRYYAMKTLEIWAGDEIEIVSGKKNATIASEAVACLQGKKGVMLQSDGNIELDCKGEVNIFSDLYVLGKSTDFKVKLAQFKKGGKGGKVNCEKKYKEASEMKEEKNYFKSKEEKGDSTGDKIEAMKKFDDPQDKLTFEKQKKKLLWAAGLIIGLTTLAAAGGGELIS